MGSPRFAIQMSLIFVGTCVSLTYFSTDAGRKFFMTRSETDQKNPGMQGFGYSTKKADLKTYYDEMEALRKTNVQPIWEEKKTSQKD